jgi:hypothetical protein
MREVSQWQGFLINLKNSRDAAFRFHSSRYLNCLSNLTGHSRLNTPNTGGWEERQTIGQEAALGAGRLPNKKVKDHVSRSDRSGCGEAGGRHRDPGHAI